MNGPCVVAAMLVCVSVLTNPSSAAPQDEAIARYRQYVAAVREEKVDKVLKLVEAVPEKDKPLLTAAVKSKIAVEAVRKEMSAQFGPPKPDDEMGRIGQLSDELLQNLEAVVEDKDTVGIVVKEPEMTAGWMVRRKGEWVVAAGVVLDLMPDEKLTELEAEVRVQMLKYAQAINQAAESILKRLRNREFKTLADANNAFGEEVKRVWPADGPVEEDD